MTGEEGRYLPGTAPGGSPSLIPIPDPSTLTRLTIDAFRAEMAGLFKAFSVEQGLHRQVLEQRLDGMDTATRLRLTVIDAFPALVDDRITDLQRLFEARLDLMAERFTSVGQRFHERDVRTEQAAVAGKQALDAALQAAKELNEAQAQSGNELNAAQARAFAEASAKSESNFTKLIDAQGAQMQAMEKGLAGQIQELKERVDRGEGKDTGTATARTSAGDQISRVVAALSLVVSVVVAAYLIARGGK